MYWDGVTVFADFDAQAARGMVAAIAAGIGAPGAAPAFSVIANRRRLGRVTMSDPIDVDGRPHDAAFDSFRFTLPHKVSPDEIRIEFKGSRPTAGIDPSVWIDEIAVDNKCLEAEVDG